MLPYELCRLCSLTPGEDKLSFSVLWEVTPDCQILRHRFAKTVINSCAQFSYEQVQSIINDSSSNSVNLPKLHGSHKNIAIRNIIKKLFEFAFHLRKKRFDNGALRIDRKKIVFCLDANLMPLEYRAEIHDESHYLIEELMLLANITVAEKLIEQYPNIAFLRSHSPPVVFALQKLQKNLENYNLYLDITNAGSINNFLLKCSGSDTKSVARMLVLNNLLAKPMMVSISNSFDAILFY